MGKQLNGVTYQLKPAMKKAVCCKCGQDLKTEVPADATNVTCFKCDQKEPAK